MISSFARHLTPGDWALPRWCYLPFGLRGGWGVSGTNFLKNMDAAEHSKTNKDTAIAKEGKQRTLILTTVMVFLHTLIFENL